MNRSANAPASDVEVECAQQATTLMLVDYDNVFPPGRDMNPSELRHVLLEYVRVGHSLCQGATELRVRLYGGWTSNGVLSRRGSEVASLIALADPFPIFTSSGVIRGQVELARSLVCEPGFVFSNTYRKRGSVPRLRLAKSPPDGCVGHDACPATLLTRFTKTSSKQCPTDTCGVTASQAFVVHEQKMVDTLLSCDLLDAGRDPAVGAVVVVSDDTDFVPPLVYAAREISGVLCLVTPSGTIGQEFVELLQTRGIQVLGPEGDVDGTG